MNNHGPGMRWNWFFGALGGLLVGALSFGAYSIVYELGNGKGYTTSTASSLDQKGTRPGESRRGSKRNAGKQLFIDNCGRCHALTQAGASGSGGPSLDQYAGGTEEALSAIAKGGSGTGGMPANLVTGREAVQLANFLVLTTGGKPEKVDLSKLIPKTKTIAVKLPPKPKPLPKSATAVAGAPGAPAAKGGAPAAGGKGGAGGGGGGPGKALFVSSCGGCHALKAAGMKGSGGPPLDAFKGKKAAILAAIKNGGKSGGMPKNLVSGAKAQQIADFIASG